MCKALWLEPGAFKKAKKPCGRSHSAKEGERRAIIRLPRDSRAMACGALRFMRRQG